MFASKMLFEQFDQDLRQGAAMPSSHYEVLARLSEAPEAAVAHEPTRRTLRCPLGAICPIRSPASNAPAGWIREACSTDRRGAFAVLTDAGFSALESASHVHVESVRTHLFDQIDSSQVRQLRAIFEQLLQHLATLPEMTSTASRLLEYLVPGATSSALTAAD